VRGGGERETERGRREWRGREGGGEREREMTADPVVISFSV